MNVLDKITTQGPDPMLSAMHELIAAVRGSMSDGMLRVEGVAEYLDMSVDHVQKCVITQPDFPAPFRLNGRGNPRWLRSAVAAWARSHTC